VVRYDKQALIHTAGLGYRSGLDNFILFDGYFFIPCLGQGLETRGFQSRSKSEILESIQRKIMEGDLARGKRGFDFRSPIGFKYLVVSAILRSTIAWDSLF